MNERATIHETLRQAIESAHAEAMRQQRLQREQLFALARQFKGVAHQLERLLQEDSSIPAQQALLSLLLPDEEWGRSGKQDGQTVER